MKPKDDCHWIVNEIRQSVKQLCAAERVVRYASGDGRDLDPILRRATRRYRSAMTVLEQLLEKEPPK